MPGLINGVTRLALLVNVGGAIAFTIAVCLVIAGLGWMAPRAGDPAILPGVLVGVVWTLLIGGLGAARWLAGRAPASGGDLRRSVTMLAVACLAYPFYTLGLSSPWLGLMANIMIAIACARIADRLASVSTTAALLVFAPIPWLIIATGVIVTELAG